MKSLLLTIVPILASAVSVNAAPQGFSWLPNSEDDLAGYEIHYGAASRTYTEVFNCQLPPTTDGRVYCTIPDVPESDTFYAAVAYDTAGNKSDYSNELSNNAPPSPVQGYRFEGTIQGVLIPIAD